MRATRIAMKIREWKSCHTGTDPEVAGVQAMRLDRERELSLSSRSIPAILNPVSLNAINDILESLFMHQ